MVRSGIARAVVAVCALSWALAQEAGKWEFEDDLSLFFEAMKAENTGVDDLQAAAFAADAFAGEIGAIPGAAAERRGRAGAEPVPEAGLADASLGGPARAGAADAEPAVAVRDAPMDGAPGAPPGQREGAGGDRAGDGEVEVEMEVEEEGSGGDGAVEGDGDSGGDADGDGGSSPSAGAGAAAAAGEEGGAPSAAGEGGAGPAAEGGDAGSPAGAVGLALRALEAKAAGIKAIREHLDGQGRMASTLQSAAQVMAELKALSGSALPTDAAVTEALDRAQVSLRQLQLLLDSAKAEKARMDRALAKSCGGSRGTLSWNSSASLRAGEQLNPGDFLSRCAVAGGQCTCHTMEVLRNGDLAVYRSIAGRKERLWSAGVDGNMYVRDGRYRLGVEPCAKDPSQHCAVVRRTAARAGAPLPVVWQTPPLAPDASSERTLPRGEAPAGAGTGAGATILHLAEDGELLVLSRARGVMWASSWVDGAPKAAGESPAEGAGALGARLSGLRDVWEEKVAGPAAAAARRCGEVLGAGRGAVAAVCGRIGGMGDESDFWLGVYDRVIALGLCAAGDGEDGYAKDFGGAPLPGGRGAAAAQERPSMVSSGGGVGAQQRSSMRSAG